MSIIKYDFQTGLRVEKTGGFNPFKSLPDRKIRFREFTSACPIYGAQGI